MTAKSAPAPPMQFYECYPNYACNSRCVFCFTPPEGRKDVKLARGLSTRQLAREIYGAYLKGCRSLRILGGEPTIRKDIVKLVALSRKMGYERIFMFSNGQKLSETRLVRRLADAGLDVVNLSVHGHTSEIHDGLTRVPGAFAKVLKSIENLTAAGIEMSLICVLNRRNVDRLADYAEFFIGKGIRRFHFFFVRYQGHMALPLPETKALRITMSDAVAPVKEAFAVCRKHGLGPPTLEHFAPCVLPGFESRMDDFYPEKGEFEKTKEEIFCVHPEGKTEAILDLSYKHKTKLKRCGRCLLRRGCVGVDASYLELFGDKEIRPILTPPRPFPC